MRKFLLNEEKQKLFNRSRYSGNYSSIIGFESKWYDLIPGVQKTRLGIKQKAYLNHRVRERILMIKSNPDELERVKHQMQAQANRLAEAREQNPELYPEENTTKKPFSQKAKEFLNRFNPTNIVENSIEQTLQKFDTPTQKKPPLVLPKKPTKEEILSYKKYAKELKNIDIKKSKSREKGDIER